MHNECFRITSVLLQHFMITDITSVVKAVLYKICYRVVSNYLLIVNEVLSMSHKKDKLG